MKKFTCFILFSFLLLFVFNSNILAGQNNTTEYINVYIFGIKGCSHCDDAKDYLTELEQKYKKVNVRFIDTSEHSENYKLLKKVKSKLDVDTCTIPFTVVGEQHFIGWNGENTTGKEIEETIENIKANKTRDIITGKLIKKVSKKDQSKNQTNITNQEEESITEKSIPEKLNLPFVGQVKTKNFSLPVLTILIALLDGFNPCAMWVLLFLISLLLGMENKKKMWLFGTVFIVASAFVYFIFIAAWLNILLFVGFIFWVRLVIGVIALYAGYYNIKDYMKNPSGGCKVVGENKRQRIFERIKQTIQEDNLFFALIGLIILAFVVNLVELMCSAGLPAVYTQILAFNNLASWQHYAYLILYVFIFMLDDLFVFFAAMITLQLTGISTKYSRMARLIGGIIMIIIGIFIIFKPQLLMFG